MDVQKMKLRKIIMGCSLIVGLVLFVFLLNVFNVYSLQFNVKENETIVVECGTSNELPKIEALYKGTLLNKAGKHVDVKADGEVNLHQIGTYPVTYYATYKGLEASIQTMIEVKDTTPPEIQLVINEDNFTSPIAQYVEEGYTAVDKCDGDLTSQVIREERDGIVYYTVSDSSGNKATVEREIVYKDVVSPNLVLNGEKEVQIGIGKEFTEPGYVATDDCDGDITTQVTVDGSVNIQEYGEYILTYQVKDSYGNVAKEERKVVVKDFTLPEITLNGKNFVYVSLGESYSEPGYTAVDNIDGDLTSSVVVSGKVDTKNTGVYELIYEVSDSSGNKRTVTRNVGVYQKQEAQHLQEGNKVVYLTFDDGPGKYTEQLLDVLDKYGVKVTFFVTNQYPAYQHLIGEVYRRGHTLALHTYSHNYGEIYCSEEAYYEDLNKIRQICIEQAGIAPNLVRFPGGTSNTISKKHCKGIMTTLAKSLGENGYYYSDWNVSSGDAGETKSEQGVFNNVISGIKRNDVSIVLQHDIKKYSVEAVDDIIAWGLSNGYTFLPMTENSKMVHFNPNN